MDLSNSDRLSEIDRAKGFAILCVVCIHAKLGEGTVVYEHVVNRAVPVFLVLFGVTAELWFRRGAEDPRERLRRWYRSRFGRLLPPVWAFATSMWLLVALFHPEMLVEHLGSVLALYVGFAPWLVTSWFVVVILQLVLLFPLLHAAAVRFGAAMVLVASAASSVLSIWYVWQIVDAGQRLFGADASEPGWYFQWIFAPRVFWHVTAGMLLAPFVGRLERSATLGSLALVIAGPFVVAWARGAPDDVFTGPLKEQIAAAIFDVPLTVLLLGVFRWGDEPGYHDSLLSWCGRRSWGIYLGHLLGYELMHLSGGTPELAAPAVRAIYALALLACGILLTLLAETFVSACSRWGSRVRARASA